MNLNSALRELKRHGTAQNRKVYRRHGVGENMYGVSFTRFTRPGQTDQT